MIKFHLKKQIHAAAGLITLEISQSIAQGDFIGLYGSSGVGKTTILRMLAGLTLPEEGHIEVGDVIWYNSTKGINLSPQKRDIGLVFQDFALFPNMTVRENIAFALPAQQDKKLIAELLDMVQLSEFAGRYPQTLSGGQQQRVAMARALAKKPKILLLDEPLSSLDQEARFTLQDEISKIHQYYGLTTILVSHDVNELSKLCNRVLEIKGRRVTREGTPAELFGEQEKGSPIQLSGIVKRILPQSSGYHIELEITDKQLIGITVKEVDFKTGDSITINASIVQLKISRL